MDLLTRETAEFLDPVPYHEQYTSSPHVLYPPFEPHLGGFTPTDTCSPVIDLDQAPRIDSTGCRIFILQTSESSFSAISQIADRMSTLKQGIGVFGQTKNQFHWI